MRLLEKIAVMSGLIVVGVLAAYRYVLTDEQREAAQEAANVLREATNEVMDSVAPLVSNGPTRAEEEAMADQNRARTAAQWEALGY